MNCWASVQVISSLDLSRVAQETKGYKTAFQLSMHTLYPLVK